MFKKLPPNPPSIVDAEYIKDYDVLVAFDNGEQRIWNGSASMRAPRAVEYNSPEEFKKFKFNKGFLYWGNEDDGFQVFYDSIYDFSFPFSAFPISS
ncbi:hypothetical protein AGMMS49991_07730 [Spirochaetia bacterium]|nr:hypothetical protein AGMMS49991_07730 [Spirochaetia bacterium]